MMAHVTREEERENEIMQTLEAEPTESANPLV